MITPLDNVHVDELLDKTLEAGCRELRLRAGHFPKTSFCRENAEAVLLPYEAPSPLDMQQMVYAIMTDEQIQQFEREGETTFSHSLARRAKFDVHIVRSKSVLEADFAAARN